MIKAIVLTGILAMAIGPAFGQFRDVDSHEINPHRHHDPVLSAKCAYASRLIRDGTCFDIACDRALCAALLAGCHINHWGYTPKCR
jgi:hypothetical protein